MVRLRGLWPLLLWLPCTALAQGGPLARSTVVPAGTGLTFALEKQVHSGVAVRGDLVPMTLVSDVRAGDVVLLPAGTSGWARVMHAQTVGEKGRSGELLLVPQSLEWQGRRVRIKGEPIAVKGGDTQTIYRGPITDPYGFSVVRSGFDAVVETGSQAQAELADDLDLGRDLGAVVAPPRLSHPPMPAGLSAPPAGKAQIVFFHAKEPRRALRGFMLRNGPGKGSAVGELGRGNWFVLTVDPGTREFTAMIEREDSMFLDLEAGETYYVKAVVGIGDLQGRPDLIPADRRTFESALPSLRRVQTGNTVR